MLNLNFFLLLVFNLFIVSINACKGCVELDELSFNKVLTKFQVTIVKFDIAFPYGDKHEAYAEFSRDIGDNIGDLLVAVVGVKDYGEKENSELAARFDVNVQEFPAIKLFTNYSTDKYIDYPKDTKINLENLKKFVRENSNLYIGLSGCVQEFDELAAKFVINIESKTLLTNILKEAKRLIEEITDEKKKETIKYYTIVMQHVIEKGIDFARTEKQRLQNVLNGKLSDKKKTEVTYRLNIIESFQIAKPDTSKTEL